MNAPEHREQGGGHLDPRLWLVVAFALGALLAGGAAVLAGTGDDTSPPPSQRGVGTPAEPRTTRTVTAAPGPARHGRVGTMQMTKPLADLAPGDRVVYNMRLCRFEHHVAGDPEVSLISCPGASAGFQVRTLTLVPVEPGAD